MLLWLLVACNNPLEDSAIPPECTPRIQYFRDQDGDGLGNSAEVAFACAAPSGFVTTSGDCDDEDATLQSGCDTAAPCDSQDTATSDCG